MNAGDRAKQVAGSRPFRLAARAGLGANGVLHLLVAVLAVQVALGGRERADHVGAMQAIASEPFGRLLVWLVVAGFAGVVLWRVREATVGFPYSPQRTKKRLFALGQIVVFSVLTVLAVRVATGSSGGNGAQGLTAAVLRIPGGRWLVLAVGVGVLVTGVIIVVQGWRLAFTEDMDLRRASRWVRGTVKWTGRVGALAKGVATMIIGVLIGVAALRYQPERAEGLDVALKTLAAEPFGTGALIVVAVGLASFGVFCFLDARYHRV